ncbi:nuclear transport factor 2 family protein [Shewanella sp. NIFS-20-20]|uniref:nuclear transport factor 2 family protein n=1 Tax=Shewanella sp. NIFS-20-20 TaxID=2853806 RepID=UPI001C43CD17|nr:nuclear transport factor 2 family protein [Shewanella sp. NIFS-20-20]MBV7314508.1 nuclear transport factor 2 family protein [Shewanella sp. NIFS-20-20]
MSASTPSLVSQASLLEAFLALYQELNKDNLHRLAEVYDQQISFIDPLHSIEGLTQLQHYFAGMYANVESLQFEIASCLTQDNQAAIFWTMHFSHSKLNRGHSIEVKGMTHLRMNDKIIYHRDYFDAGQMLYRHVPLLGSAIKAINRRLAVS